MNDTALGVDIGTSAVKVSLLDVETGYPIARATAPRDESIRIQAPKPEWAEQDPEIWWRNLVAACSALAKESPDAFTRCRVIGLSYQEHGLVLLDKQGKSLRPAIIWCDSRATSTADELEEKIGTEEWFSTVSNRPGNFTISKLAWVMSNEPQLYEQASTAMLPGDYIAFRLTGKQSTTVEGLSEGMFYSMSDNSLAQNLISRLGINTDLLPEVVNNFSNQGKIRPEVAQELGLSQDVHLAFRGGDQHSNAVGLNVLEPGQFACGAGTSGVILAVTDKPVSDRSSRVNTFLHVNHRPNRRRYAVVLCINGMGIAYSWLLQLLRSQCSTSVGYGELNRLASSAPLGSDGLRFLPFGNGAERLLNNQAPGASLLNADFNRHDLSHVSRAVIEGVVMAIMHGNTVLDELAISPSVLRAGDAGLFKCDLFSQLLSTALDCPIELRDSDPSQGAATGALVSAGYADSVAELVGNQSPKALIEPVAKEKSAVLSLYESWSAHLPSASF